VAKVNHCRPQGISGVNGRIGYAIVLSNGQTFGRFAVPQLQYAYKRQEMPPMLPGVPTVLPERSET
jgi:hypothetical protein